MPNLTLIEEKSEVVIALLVSKNLKEGGGIGIIC